MTKISSGTIEIDRLSALELIAEMVNPDSNSEFSRNIIPKVIAKSIERDRAHQAEKIIRDNYKVIESSHNQSITFISKLVEHIFESKTASLPVLRGGDTKNLFNLLLSDKIITKPEYRSYVRSKMPNKTKIKKADETLFDGFLYTQIGKTYNEIPRINAFSNSIEYKILKESAKSFEIPEFRNPNDFDTTYDESSEVEDKLKGKFFSKIYHDYNALESEHATHQMINFLYHLCDAARKRSSGLLSNLSDKEYNLFALSIFIISKMFKGIYDFKIILNSLDLKQANEISNECYAGLFSDDLDSYIFSDDDLSELTQDVLLLVAETHPESDNNSAKHMLDHYSIAIENLLSIILISSKISENKDVIDNIICRKIRDTIEDGEIVDVIATLVKKIKSKSLIDSESCDQALEIVNEIKTSCENLGRTSDAALLRTADAIGDAFKLLNDFSLSKLTELCVMIEKLNDDAIQEILSNNPVSAKQLIDESIEVKAEAKSIIISSLSQFNDDLTSLSKEALEHKPEPCALTQENEALTSRNKELEHTNQVSKENEQALNVSIAKQNKTILSLEAKYDGAIKKGSMLTQGFSDSLSNIMFGNPTCSDVVNAVCENYTFIIVSDSLSKQLNKCAYAQPLKLFKALNQLAGEYFTAITNGVPDSQAKSIIEPHYRANESASTMNAVKTRNKRIFSFSGNKITCEQHLTIGELRDPTKTVQVYFKIEDSKLLLAYVGEHLAVSSS